MTQYGTLSPEAPAGTIPEGDALLNHADRSLLIVDDDKPFSTRLARAMEARGYLVHVAESVAEGVSAVTRSRRPSRSSTCGSATATAST